MFFKILLLQLIVSNTNGFFYVTQLNQNETNSSLIKDFQIEYSNLTDTFPDTFKIKFSELDQDFEIDFVEYDIKNNEGIVSYFDDVYVIDNNTKQPVKYSNSLPVEKFRFYVQKGGNGYATLIENRKKGENPFRMLGTVYANDTDFAFDISPISDSRTKRGIYDSKRNYHKITRRSIVDQPSEIELIDPKDDLKDYIVLPDTPQSARRNYNFLNKRSTDPITLNVEVLVVTDSTVFRTHQKFCGTSNTEIVFLHMRHYYAHLIHGVNQKYQNSFTSDPDLRINIILSNFLFLTDPSEQWWLNPQIVGDPNNPSFNGREVVITSNTLSSFAEYMNKKTFPFSFDHAVALFNKDLWSADQSPSRSLTVGFASIGTICTRMKYSLSEETGGFINLLVVAHEIGHGLGAFHDGIIGSTDRCPINNRDIMSPSVGGGSSHRFSSCSLSMFKTALLTNNFKSVAAFAQCLLNVPKEAAEFSRIHDSSPGEIYSVDDLCKMIYGQEASYCRNRAENICKSLSCRVNSTSSFCVQNYEGAPEGTPCDSGKVCTLGVCTPSSKAKFDACVFGDDVVTREVETEIQLPSPQVTCSQYFGILQSLDKSVIDYCAKNEIKSVCCQSCKKYNALTCRDTFSNCPSNTACNSQVITGGQYRFIYDLCPRTCQRCRPLACTDAPNICENGATCVTRNVASNSLFAFNCICSPGYTGEYCEKSLITNPCTSNPCKNGGTCYSFTSSLFICVCPSYCSGLNCGDCLFQVAATTQRPVASTQLIQNFQTCLDESKFCKLFADYCQLNAFFDQKTIKQACAETCGVCTQALTTTTTTQAQKCFDQDPKCNDFRFLCFFFDSKYFSGEWLIHPCYRTCGHC